MNALNYGGQAVMEGVLMRGEREWAVCVRDPSGELVVHREALPKAIYRSRVFRWPFFRGLVVLWDSLGLGLKALTWSADIAMSEEEDVEFSGPVAWTTIGLSLALGIGLFFLLPMFLITLVDRYIGSPLLSNLSEGLVRLGIFVAYLWGIGLMPDICRVFAYHGAEHKTINAYEHGAPLEPQAVDEYPRIHTRCGTSFLLIVLVVFVLISTMIGRPPLLIRLLSRIILIPVVAGISYELLKLSSRYYEKSAIVRAIFAPGLALQHLTTREPDLSMLEVGIRALKEVLHSEGLLEEEELGAE
ncbi:MAG: DUF1385 domain-containing protein [Chloroflexota bacterium]|nr:DUF1385 domain-containing protein [Chloroflexota bacterium]